MLLLPVGPVHKERHTSDCAVGAWRHKLWILCPIGSISRLVLFDLVHNESMVDFLWENPTREYPFWQTRPILNNWSKKDGVGYNLMFNALKKAIDKLKIPLNKVTHMRQHNIEYQGFQVSIYFKIVYLLIFLLTITIILTVSFFNYLLIGYGSSRRFCTV